MLESVFTRKLLKDLRAHPALQGAYIAKHNDYYTSGILDFSISIGVITLWFEVKIHPNTCTKLQEHTLKTLREGGFLITATHDGALANLEGFDSYVPSMRLHELVNAIAIRCVNAGRRNDS